MVVFPEPMPPVQQTALVFFESAILFEAGLTSYFDAVICVTATLQTRIERVMKRDVFPEPMPPVRPIFIIGGVTLGLFFL